MVNRLRARSTAAGKSIRSALHGRRPIDKSWQRVVPSSCHRSKRRSTSCMTVSSVSPSWACSGWVTTKYLPFKVSDKEPGSHRGIRLQMWPARHRGLRSVMRGLSAVPRELPIRCSLQRDAHITAKHPGCHEKSGGCGPVPMGDCDQPARYTPPAQPTPVWRDGAQANRSLFAHVRSARTPVGIRARPPPRAPTLHAPIAWRRGTTGQTRHT